MADGAAPTSQTTAAPVEAAAAASRLTPERRKVLQMVVGGIAAIVLAFAAHWLLVGRWEQKTDNAYVRADISIVAPKVEGYVTAVKVDDNQAVKAGDVLVQIDDADYKAALARAQANLARAKAQAAASVAASRGAGTRVGQQGAQIAQAQAALAAAQAEQARLAADRERFAALAAKGLVAPARLEQIDAQAKSAAANARAAAAQLTYQREQTGVLSSSRASAGGEAAAAAAAVKAAEADLAVAKLNLERTRLVAPIDGVVGDRTVRVGQLVRSGVQVMAIVPVSDVYVVANFKETQLGKMRPGQKVKLKVDAYPDLKLEGRITSLAPASGAQFSLVPTDTATGNFTKIVQRVPVKIAVALDDEARGLLRPGLSVEAVVDTHPVRGSAPAAKVAAATRAR
ncbi:MAG: HlyD family secretion protein [Alphaproteobacteria bacterium]|nr:HlyD family secretion protein [Alphaproteobacteria bacterium]